MHKENSTSISNTAVDAVVYFNIMEMLHLYVVYFISKESKEEQSEGSSGDTDGRGENSTTTGNFKQAHMQYSR